MGVAQRRDSSSMHSDLSGLPCNAHCDVIRSHRLEKENCLTERGMELSNGADMGAGPSTAITCQSSTVIWSPCLGALGAVFWETEHGTGGSRDRLRGM